MWQSWKHISPKDAAHVVIFILGVAAVALGIITHDLGLIAAGTTLFGVVSIGRA